MSSDGDGIDDLKSFATTLFAVAAALLEKLALTALRGHDLCTTGATVSAWCKDIRRVERGLVWQHTHTLSMRSAPWRSSSFSPFSQRTRRSSC